MALSRTITALAASSCVASEIPPICDGKPAAFGGITSGVVGVVGDVGVDGVDGEDGEDGIDGVDGVDGVGLDGVKLPDGVEVI